MKQNEAKGKTTTGNNKHKLQISCKRLQLCLVKEQKGGIQVSPVGNLEEVTMSE